MRAGPHEGGADRAPEEGADVAREVARREGHAARGDDDEPFAWDDEFLPATRSASGGACLGWLPSTAAFLACLGVWWLVTSLIIGWWA